MTAFIFEQCCTESRSLFTFIQRFSNLISWEIKITISAYQLTPKSYSSKHYWALMFDLLQIITARVIARSILMRLQWIYASSPIFWLVQLYTEPANPRLLCLFQVAPLYSRKFLLVHSLLLSETTLIFSNMFWVWNHFGSALIQKKDKSFYFENDMIIYYILILHNPEFPSDGVMNWVLTMELSFETDFKNYFSFPNCFNIKLETSKSNLNPHYSKA